MSNTTDLIYFIAYVFATKHVDLYKAQELICDRFPKASKVKIFRTCSIAYCDRVKELNDRLKQAI